MGGVGVALAASAAHPRPMIVVFIPPRLVTSMLGWSVHPAPRPSRIELPVLR